MGGRGRGLAGVPAHGRRGPDAGVPVNANGGREVEVGESYWIFTSENDVENGLGNQTNRAGGCLRTIEAEDCLSAAERFAVSCTDTDLAQMAEMLTGLK